MNKKQRNPHSAKKNNTLYCHVSKYIDTFIKINDCLLIAPKTLGTKIHAVINIAFTCARTCEI